MTERDFWNACFELVIGSEGGYQNAASDRGNWTSGRIGKGVNKGTKYGISAMSYPDLDIIGLTLDDARAIYHKDYYTRASCHSLPSHAAYLLFDAAVNHGVDGGIKLLQRSLNVTADGIIGPITIGSVYKKDVDAFIRDWGLARMKKYNAIDNPIYADGWHKRNFLTCVHAMDLSNKFK